MAQSAKNILILPGDGIGQEIVAEAKKLLSAIQTHTDFTCETQEAVVGGTAYDQTGNPLPEQTLTLAKQADGILFGAVGGPKWDALPPELRPEKALLRLRSELALFANLRPAMLYPQLADASSLKPEIVSGLDIVIVRELTGGIYFGSPRGTHTNEAGEMEGFNTYRYAKSEIERIGKVAFELAMKRNKKLCSVDKANVLEVTRFWREVMIELSAKYPEVELSHMYVDNAAMQLVKAPKQFDVMVTGNMFGDILSDEAAMLTGSIGMLPSASLDTNNKGMYEPCHGSAPDIAGQNLANPLATILSLAMMLRVSFNQGDIADRIEQAVSNVLDSGLRTGDIQSQGSMVVGTKAMGDAVVEAFIQQH